MPSKVIIPLAKGDYLGEVGYKAKEQLAADRRQRLDKAVKKHGYKPVALRLNAMAIRLKNISPVSSRKFKHDLKWLHHKYRD